MDSRPQPAAAMHSTVNLRASTALWFPEAVAQWDRRFAVLLHFVGFLQPCRDPKAQAGLRQVEHLFHGRSMHDMGDMPTSPSMTF